jgi:hypothetical protein
MEKEPQKIVLRIAKDIKQHTASKKMKDYLGDHFGEINISSYSLKSLAGPAKLSADERQKLVVQEIVDRLNKIEAWGDKFVVAIEIIIESKTVAEAIYESFRIGEIQPLLIIAVFEGKWRKDCQSPSPKKDKNDNVIFSHYATFRFVQGIFQETEPLNADAQEEDI